MEHRFQINLSGIIDLLSNHLYSSPAVYVRELLQNGVDAIRARERLDEAYLDEAYGGEIHIQLARSETGHLQLVFQDNGIGLTEEETHRFVSTIGESSKRDVAENRNDFIGQFGIGLLSNFIVSDEIFMVTKSARSADPKVVEWRGRADGTYDVSTREDESVEPGTTVFLRCKEGCEEWFEADRVRDLTIQYGALLPYPIKLTAHAGSEIVNHDIVPWRRDFETRQARWDANMEFGEQMFEQEFFDCIPLRSEVGDVDGVAYILPFTPSPTARRAHRVYLKNMLLSEASENLLPSWAFFVTCVVNTNELRPVASREAFYEDEMLQQTRAALGEALRQYLIRLKDNDPQRLKGLITLHYRAIKALAVHDDEFYRIFVDLLPFETSLGRMSMGKIRDQFEPPIRYVPSVDTFRQIAQVAASQSMGVINAGYSYDAELVQKLERIFEIDVERIDSTELAETLEELGIDQREEVFELVKVADLVLQPFKCRTEVKRFQPHDLPALYLAGDDANFMRSLEQSREVSDDHWSSILSNLADSRQVDSYAQLCFNYDNPLVRKLARMEDRNVLRLSVQMLYVQALLLGHHPLSSDEMAILNTGLLDLIDLAIEQGAPSGGWVQ